MASHTKAARCLDIVGNYLVTGGLDHFVHLYTYDSASHKYNISMSYPFFKDYIYSVCIFPDASKFAVACKNKNIYICSTTNAEAPLQVLTGHTGIVSYVRPIGNTRLLSGSWDATAKIWDLATGQAITTLSGHTYAVSA
jgi:WD40 repeat protein